jgi:hypothetical protein
MKVSIVKSMQGTRIPHILKFRDFMLKSVDIPKLRNLVENGKGCKDKKLVKKLRKIVEEASVFSKHGTFLETLVYLARKEPEAKRIALAKWSEIPYSTLRDEVSKRQHIFSTVRDETTKKIYDNLTDMKTLSINRVRAGIIFGN